MISVSSHQQSKALLCTHCESWCTEALGSHWFLLCECNSTIAAYGSLYSSFVNTNGSRPQFLNVFPCSETITDLLLQTVLEQRQLCCLEPADLYHDSKVPKPPGTGCKELPDLEGVGEEVLKGGFGGGFLSGLLTVIPALVESLKNSVFGSTLFALYRVLSQYQAG